MTNMWRNPPYYQQSFSWQDRLPAHSRPDRNSCPPAGFGMYDNYRPPAVWSDWPESPVYREAAVPRLWMPKQDDEWENEQDMEYFLEMCPGQVKAMQRHVEEICDHFDYDGSPLYDEFPDRIAMMRLRDMTLKRAGKDETLFGKNGYFDEPGCAAAKDMAEILLYNETVRRRKRQRGMS